MAKNQAIRIRPTALQADLNACTALQSLSGYKPSNPAYATTAATDKLSAMQAAQEAEVDAQNRSIPPATMPPPQNGIFTTPCWASRIRWWRNTEKTPTNSNPWA